MFKCTTFVLFICIFLQSFCIIAQSNFPKKPFKAKVTRIVDGDTYDVEMSDRRTIRIRMFGIDAPEKSQSNGQKAMYGLSALCYGKTIQINPVGTDPNRRLVADAISAEGINLNIEMVKLGLAWHFKRYSDNPLLAIAEKEARAARKGLWKEDNPIPPWEYRAKSRFSHK
jgi:endonuclease YncB( thermonuclease family)